MYALILLLKKGNGINISTFMKYTSALLCDVSDGSKDLNAHIHIKEMSKAFFIIKTFQI